MQLQLCMYLYLYICVWLPAGASTSAGSSLLAQLGMARGRGGPAAGGGKAGGTDGAKRPPGPPGAGGGAAAAAAGAGGTSVIISGGKVAPDGASGSEPTALRASGRERLAKALAASPGLRGLGVAWVSAWMWRA